jgi:hypothetical protein
MNSLAIVRLGLEELQQAISISYILNRFRTANFKLTPSRLIPLYFSGGGCF